MTVKLTKTQLNKLKPAAKNKTGTTLRITKKNYQDEELPHELFLTTKQKAKIRTVFTSNLSIDIALGKEAARAGKGYILFVFSKKMNDNFEIIKSQEDSRVLVFCVTEKVKH